MKDKAHRRRCAFWLRQAGADVRPRSGSAVRAPKPPASARSRRGGQERYNGRSLGRRARCEARRGRFNSAGSTTRVQPQARRLRPLRTYQGAGLGMAPGACRGGAARTVRSKAVRSARRHMTRVEFQASFPLIQSAIKRSGDSGGMRIQLDIPESEMANAALLLVMVQQRLRVTIEVIPDNDTDQTDRPDRTVSRTAAKKRN